MFMESHFQNNRRLPVGEMLNISEEQNSTRDSDANAGDRRSSSTRRGGHSNYRGRGRGSEGGPGRDRCSTLIRSSLEPIIDSPDLSSIHSSEELW